MQRMEFDLEKIHITFLNEHAVYGFEDPSAMARAALNLFKKALDLQRLKQSAELYAELYAQDTELRALTEITAG